ncbi:MAG: hypothetical protein K2K45_12230 [Muribaculaceae bacterium]|nr:hypothetical protein [Muribaculaceae bacterium]
MGKTGYEVWLIAAAVLAGCTSEKQMKDRSDADDMFRRISALVENYTDKVSAAGDSAAWVQACVEFEDSLDRISFSYPPDTDMLLTEGQNDTVFALMQEYIKARDTRIGEILHPVVESDSIADSLALEDVGLTEVSPADASRSPGN